jgi:hypothetical protein
MPFIVTDTAFNRANYPTLVGKVYDIAPSYAQVKRVEGVAHWGFYLTNWQYGGYNEIEEKPGYPIERWIKVMVDYADPEQVLNLAEKAGADAISLAGGFWQRLGKKGYGERVTIPEARRLLQEAKHLAASEFIYLNWRPGLTGTREADYKGYKIIENLQPVGIQARYLARDPKGYTFGYTDDLQSLLAKIDSEVKTRVFTFPLQNPSTAQQSIGTSILKTLVEHTIDDITYEQMNRIVRRLSRMPESDRHSPVRVGQVIADELGEEKALQYVEKALANGMIKRSEYEPLRAAIILRMPREKIPRPWAAAGASELLAGQRKLQQDLAKVRELGVKSLQKPMETLNKDIERMRRAWGL